MKVNSNLNFQKILIFFGYLLISCSILQFIMFFALPVANGSISIAQLLKSINFLTVLSALITYLLSTFSGFVLIALGKIMYSIEQNSNKK